MRQNVKIIDNSVYYFSIQRIQIQTSVLSTCLVTKSVRKIFFFFFFFFEDEISIMIYSNEIIWNNAR
jgi:hypothetical protein